MYRLQSRFAEAETYYLRAGEILERSLGTHPDLAANLFNLARLYQMSDRLEESEALYRRSLAMFESTRADPGSLDTVIAGYAGLLDTLERPDEARRLRDRILRPATAE
jgi:tetratricopeptide (TPR) repeat protein